MPLSYKRPAALHAFPSGADPEFEALPSGEYSSRVSHTSATASPHCPPMNLHKAHLVVNNVNPPPVRSERCKHNSHFVCQGSRAAPRKQKRPRGHPRGRLFNRSRRRLLQPAKIASISNATILVILIIGFTAGPAVSLYGSPTVSPVTAALCASEPLPPWLPSWLYFFAFSRAPPTEATEIATNCPATNVPSTMAPGDGKTTLLITALVAECKAEISSWPPAA
jgi:hypothetical protein